MLTRKFLMAMMMLVILILILMLFNLNTDYADTDAELFPLCSIFTNQLINIFKVIPWRERLYSDKVSIRRWRCGFSAHAHWLRIRHGHLYGSSGWNWIGLSQQLFLTIEIPLLCIWIVNLKVTNLLKQNLNFLSLKHCHILKIISYNFGKNLKGILN